MSASITLATAGRVLRQLRHDHRTLAMLRRRARACSWALLAWVFDGTTDLRRDRRAAARHLPVRRDVPRHVGRHPARAHLGDPRAAAHDADRQARPAARLRAGLRRSSPIVQAALATRALGHAARPGRRGTRCGCCSSSRSATPCWAWRSGSSSARSRPPSSRPCSSCRRSCCRSSCCAGCWCRATSWTTCCGGSPAVLPLSYAVDAMRDLTTNEEVDPSAWVDLSVVVLAILLALGLGAATLRRRTP